MVIRIVLLVILLLLHCVDLGVRPPHHDESVNGWFVDGILNRGFYVYDPQNYHGPLYFYFLTLFEMLFGRSVVVLRWTTIILGWMVSLTPFLFRRWLTSRGAWIAAFFLAVSPMMVFFSRYAIHEMGFMLACILFFYYWLRAREDSLTPKNIAGLGITLGVMACMKENFVLYLATLLIAEGCIRVYEKRFTFQNPKKLLLGSLGVVAIGFAIVVLVYSALFHDQNGVTNFFKAFMFWSETGTKGNGHQKPFYYWINLMTQFEWLSMFGLLMVPLALRKVPEQLRLVSVTGFGLFLAYSIVAYKTPWCAMSFYWAFIFVAGYWLSKGMEKKTYRTIILAALICGYGFSAYQSYDVAYANPDQDGHPYIYGQTYRDLMVPMNEIIDAGHANPSLHQTMRIQVISLFTWPLPYILGEFKNTAFFGEQNAPAQLDGDYVIIDRSIEEKYAPRIKGNYSRREVRSRQWASPMVIYKKGT
jgi:uncharacterized protein (TIGR03663 family)